MDCRKLNIALKTSIIVLSVVATLVLIKALFSGFNGFEWGSVTDWLSTIANIVMASAAVYAALQAKKWFKQKKYELAHSLARDLTYTLYEIEGILGDIDARLTLFNVSSSTDDDIGEIKFYIDKLCSLISKKEKMLFELKRLHWTLKSEFDDIYHLPSCLDFETLIGQVELSLSMYNFHKATIESFDTLSNHSNSESDHLEFDVRQIKGPFKEYDIAIEKFLAEDIAYEEYFDIAQ